MNKKLALLSITLFFSCYGMSAEERELLNRLGVPASKHVEVLASIRYTCLSPMEKLERRERFRHDLASAHKIGDVEKVRQLLRELPIIYPDDREKVSVVLKKNVEEMSHEDIKLAVGRFANLFWTTSPEIADKVRRMAALPENLKMPIYIDLYGATGRGEVDKVKELLQTIARFFPVKKLEEMSPTEMWSEQGLIMEAVAFAVNSALSVAADNSDKEGPREIFSMLLDPRYNPYFCRMGWEERCSAAKVSEHKFPGLARVLMLS